MSFYSEASLAYVASAGAGKDGKAYSMKPVDGTGDFTFSRGSNLAATRVGPTGLIEKGRENLLSQSNNFSQWSTNVSALTSGQTGYDGLSDAWLLTKSGANGFVYRSVSGSGIQTVSVYAKQGTNSWMQIYVVGTSNVRTYFDLGNGTLGAYAFNVIDRSIEDVGNGWYRCSVVFNNSTSQVRFFVSDGNNDDTGTSGSIYIQDAQLELGLATTDYIESGASTGKAGLLEDEPRFDYSGGATCPSLLLEPSRTNKLPYSEYFGAWTIQSGITLTPNTDETLSPEGLNNAYKIVSTIGTTGFYFAGLNSTAASIRSIYLKGSAGGETLALKDPSGNGSFTSVTLTTEWQRFTHSTSNTGQNYQGLQIDDISVGTIYAYGAQWEEASYPTSYIPNHSGGTITRGDDDASNTGTIDADNDFTFYFESTLMAEYFTDKYFNSTNFGYLSGYNISGNNLRHRFGGTNYGFTAPEGVFKYLIRKDSTNMKIYLNGTLERTITTLPTGTGDLNLLGGKVHKTLYFPEALSDADCITLTT